MWCARDGTNQRLLAVGELLLLVVPTPNSQAAGREDLRRRWGQGFAGERGGGCWRHGGHVVRAGREREVASSAGNAFRWLMLGSFVCLFACVWCISPVACGLLLSHFVVSYGPSLISPSLCVLCVCVCGCAEKQNGVSVGVRRRANLQAGSPPFRITRRARVVGRV